METLSIKTDCNRIKWQERGQNLNCRSSSLIHNINLILELIIRNTLKYNKFTSAEEVFEYVLTLHGGNAFQNSDQELELVLDKEIIVFLCVIHYALIMGFLESLRRMMRVFTD